LEREWSEKKEGKLWLFGRISLLVAQYAAEEADVVANDEKNALINSLRSSTSFTNTHRVIGELASVPKFSPEQAILVVKAALENEQVRLILADTDVADFLQKIIAAHGSRIPREDLERLPSFLQAARRPAA
jgi:hypothetical protein